ncbi:MAG: hypothetical protein GX256_05450, partial [Fretibacterium sp.]|nr:hypothetical protein [Fretibacterium sp.]
DAQRELALLEQERQDFERESELAADDARRWEEGRRTLSLGAFYASLTQLRDEQETDKRSQSSLLSHIPRAQASLKSAEEALELAEIYLRDKLIAQKKLEESVRAVRELDSCIEKKKAQVFELMENTRELDIRERKLHAKSETVRETIEKLGVELRDLRKFVQSNAADEKLLQELGGIRKCFSLFLAAQEKKRELKAAYSDGIQKKQQAQTALNDRQALFSEMAVQFASVEKRFQVAQDAFDSSLKGKAPQEWRETLTAQREKLEQVEKLQEKLEQQLLMLQDLDGAQNRRLTLEGEKKDLSLKEVELEEQLSQEKEDVRLLENRFTLTQLTASFDEARKILQDETPCPLCGASTHPYVTNGIPDTNDIGLKLGQAREQQEKTQALVALLRVRMSDLSEEILSLSQAETRIRGELQPLEQEISHLTASLNLKFAVGVPPLEELRHFRQRLRETFQRTQETVLALSAAEEDLQAAREELERAQSNQEELTRFHQEAIFRLKTEQGKADVLERELRGHEESLNNIRRDLTGQIAYFGYKHLPDDRPERVLDALEERAAIWKSRAERKQELEKEEFVVTEQLKVLQREQVQLRTEVQAQRELLKRAEVECGAFQHQRTGLFETRDPDQEEVRMQAVVEKARQQEQERRTARGEAQNALDALTRRQHELETALAVRRDRIQKEEIAFGKKLLAGDFKNEDDYLSACLSERERRELQERLQERSRRELDLNARYLDKKFVLEELYGRKPEGGNESSSNRGSGELLRELRDCYLEVRNLARRNEKQAGEILSSLKPLNGERVTLLSDNPEAEKLRASLRDFVLENIAGRARASLALWGEGVSLERRSGTSVLCLRDPKGESVPQTPAALLALSVALARTLAPRFTSETLFLAAEEGMPRREIKEFFRALNCMAVENKAQLIFARLSPGGDSAE